MAKSLRSHVNKSEQLARFLLQHGDFMTARQIADAGFTYADGTVDSAAEIGSVLGKLHQSSRFTVERRDSDGPRVNGGRAHVMVKVIDIAPRRPADGQVDVVGTPPNLWRQLLSRQVHEKLELGAQGEAE